MDEDWSWAHTIERPKDDSLLDQAKSDQEAGASADDQGSLSSQNESVHVGRGQLHRLQSLARTFKDTYDRLTIVRDEVMLLRNEGIYERQECAQRRTFFMRSQDDFYKQLHPFRSHATQDSRVSIAPNDHLEGLQQQLKDDCEAVEAQDKRVREIESQLSQREYYLQDKEAALATVSDDLVAILEQLSILASDDDPVQRLSAARETHHPPSTGVSSSSLPPDLEDYFEKMGAVGWSRDRLMELRLEYEEQRADRVFRRDHEEVLEMTDEQFQADFDKTIASAHRDLADAEQKAEEAKKACWRKGLDPEVYQQQRLDEVQDSQIAALHPREDFGDLASSDYHTLPPVHTSVMSERKSSTALTDLTGALYHDQSMGKRRIRDDQNSRLRVENWIYDHQLAEHYPFEEERFLECPDSRPLLRRSIDGLFDKLRDFVVDPDIRERLPIRLGRQSILAANIISRWPPKRQPGRARSFSDPGLCTLMTRS